MALERVGMVEPLNGTDVAVFDSHPAEAAIQAPVPTAAQRTTINLVDLEAKGFGGLVFDWTAFPMVSLKTDGNFEDSNGQGYGKGFDCKVMGSKSKYAHSFDGCKDPKTGLIYSYDKETSTGGKSVAEFNARLAAEGKEITTKEYLEVMVELVAPGEAHDGEFRLVSVSPTSKGRFSSYIFKLAQKGITETAITRIEVGEKVRNVANPFYPFNFVLVSN